MNFGGLIDHLVHGQRNEIAEHDIDDRTKAGHGCTDSNASKASFGNWGIHYSLGAKFLHQPGEEFERRTRLRHIFADDADARVAAHLFRQCLTHGLSEGQLAGGGLRHRRASPLRRRWDKGTRWRTSPPLPSAHGSRPEFPSATRSPHGPAPITNPKKS